MKSNFSDDVCTDKVINWASLVTLFYEETFLFLIPSLHKDTRMNKIHVIHTNIKIKQLDTYHYFTGDYGRHGGPVRQYILCKMWSV